MTEHSPVEQLDAILDDAGAAFADASGLACSTAELREHARQRVRALAPGLPRFRRKINRGLFEPLTAPLLGLYQALREAGGLERDAALALCEQVIQSAWQRRLDPPIKGKLMGAALRLPVVRNTIRRAVEGAALEPGGFVMRGVESPGVLMGLDVVHCPIAVYFAEHGAPELGPLVCKIDDMMVETMPGITLERSGTIAQGAPRCDFRYRRSR